MLHSMALTLESCATLRNGVKIPRIGLGVYQSPPGDRTVRAVKYALEIGYRHIDTAYIYGNEADVGTGIRQSGVKRDEVFVTTKVWNSNQGYTSTIQACEKSLEKLGLNYVDLYLIHWPVQGMSLETWEAMVWLLQEGKARAIGVSNYELHHLLEILENSEVSPAVNQIEFHPFLYQRELLRFCEENKIMIEGYSPLTRGMRLSHSIILIMGKKYAKTPAQILIRWSLQHGLVVIPKSIHNERILENSLVFDFNIELEDMKILDSLNENLRTVFLS
jgi:diketogulonate reductase-like aldo/keto reductase